MQRNFENMLQYMYSSLLYAETSNICKYRVFENSYYKLLSLVEGTK